jgi:hypothetical protein
LLSAPIPDIEAIPVSAADWQVKVRGPDFASFLERMPPA